MYVYEFLLSAQTFPSESYKAKNKTVMVFDTHYMRSLTSDDDHQLSSKKESSVIFHDVLLI